MKKIRAKGIIVALFGASITSLSVYASNYLKGIQGFYKGISSIFSKSPFSGFLGGQFKDHLYSWDALIRGCFWTGIAIFILGSLMITLGKANRH
ncbi:MAG: hypothetical protein EBZ47_06735 [Chlamydiae bacterium]|nr:hypothetical protein [Chlamydiota bacterium]